LRFCFYSKLQARYGHFRFLVCCHGRQRLIFLRAGTIVVKYEVVIKQESLERPDQISVDIKAIMRHGSWCYKGAGAKASVFQLRSMFNRY